MSRVAAKQAPVAKAAAKAQPTAARHDGPEVKAEAPVVNPWWQALTLGVRPRLEVSSPDDPEEREADRIADRLMRMPADDQALPEQRPVRAEHPVVQRKCTACAQEDDEARLELMRSPAGSGRAAEAEVDADALARLGPGAPLARAQRHFFEPRMGVDLSPVRIHTDAAAAAVAHRLQARAFAYGPHVAFAASAYAPQTPSGRRLLAHELVHVAQHRAPTQVRRAPDDEQEDSADAAAALQEYVDEATLDADQDDDMMARAHGTRMVLLLTWKTRSGLKTVDEVDEFVADCEDLAETEMDTLGDFGPAGVELALATHPKGFPLTWSGRVQAALTLGVDPATIITEWADERAKLVKTAAGLGPEIFAHGLPLPFDDVERAKTFKLRIADSAAQQSSAVRDFARDAVRYTQIKFVSAFALAWENAVDEIAEAVADGTVVPDYLDWKDFVDNKQAKLRELPQRARERFARSDEDAEQLQADALAFGDAALAAGLFGGLAALLGILSGWSEAQELFDGALKEADASVAGAGGPERVWAAMNWAYDNGYMSGAALELGRSLIDNGPQMLGETAAILIGGRIPGVNIAVAIYLAVTTARDAIALIDEFGTAMNNAIQAQSVAELQSAAKALAQVGVKGGFVLATVLVAHGVSKIAGKIRQRAAELRAADATLTEEAAHRRALDELSAAERKVVEEGPAKIAKKFEDFGGVCLIGSINCRVLPERIKTEAGTYPTDGGVPFPRGMLRVQKAALVGTSRSSALLREIVLKDPSRWPAFEAALAKAKAKGQSWPVDADGVAWQVHHVKPVFMGGGNDVDNLFPLPPATHQKYTNWWNAVHRAFKNRFTADEWDEIYFNQRDVPGSRVPARPK